MGTNKMSNLERLHRPGGASAHYPLSDRDCAILDFLWRWKVATTQTLHAATGSGRTDYASYKALARLERLKYIEAKVIKRFCKSIGVTDIRFHDLRATFITNLLARGEPLVRVMATVGHSDMETTNVYLRKAGIEIQGATERLGYRIPEEGGAKVLTFTPRSVQT